MVKFIFTGVDGDKTLARCKICRSNFKINGSGVGQIKAHAATIKHTSAQQILNKSTSQSIFTVNDSQLQLSRGN